MQNELNHLVIAKDFEAKQEFNSRFLSDNIKDLTQANDFLRKKVELFEQNNLILGGANKNLAEQLDKYQKIEAHLLFETEKMNRHLQTTGCHGPSIDVQIEVAERCLDKERKEDTSFKSDIQVLGSQKRLLETQLVAHKTEVLQFELQLKDFSEQFPGLSKLNKELKSSLESKQRETEIIEAQIVECKTQNEFSKQEVDELGQTLMQKEQKMQNLLKQRQHLQSLATDFNRLRISYTEKLNDQVFARNVIIKKIMEDNSRLDALSQDADKTLKNIKGLLI